MAQARHLTPRDRKQLNRIKELVLWETDISTNDFESRSRLQANVRARQMFVYLTNRYAMLSSDYNAIAKYMDLDHTTIIHNLRKAKELVSQCEQFETSVERCGEILLESVNSKAFDEIQQLNTLADAKNLCRRYRKELKLQEQEIARLQLSVRAHKLAVEKLRTAKREQAKRKPLPLF